MKWLIMSALPYRKNMNGIDKEKLKEEIKDLTAKNSFQLYSFIKNYS